MNLLEMNHIEKKFDDLQVLKDISLAVEEDEPRLKDPGGGRHGAL